MPRLRVLIAGVKGLFRKRRRDQELHEELLTHLEMSAEENLRKGMPTEEARRVAKVAFGGVAQTEEAYREALSLHFIQTLFQDLRYAVRMLRRAPGLAAVVVISLALGIGANTAIFSAIDAVMLRMLPVEEPQELVMLEWHAKDWPEKFVGDLEGSSFGDDKQEQSSYSFAYQHYQQIKDQNHVFSVTFAFAANSDRVNVGIDGHAGAAVIHGVSGNYFEGLGVRAVTGRTIIPEDDQDSAPAVAVVSYQFWQQQLGGSSQVAGKTVIMNGRPVTIVGVVPREFFGLEPGSSPDMFIPLAMYSAEQSRQGGSDSGMTYLKDPKVWWTGVVGRLKPGVTSKQAEAELGVIFDQSMNALVPTPDANKPMLRVAPVKQGLDSLRRQFSSSLLLLMMMVGAVLLIACGNVAALLLTRASARQREIAVRLSLGASRMRLVRQLLTESVLLACCGGLVGLLVATWAGRVLVALLSSGREQIHLDLSLDVRVLAFTSIVSIASGILFGLVPALRATRTDLFSSLKQPALGAVGHKFAAGKVLVAGQVGLCLLLLVSAALMLRTLNSLQGVDLGFDRQNILLFTVRPGLNGYKSAQLDEFYLELQRRIQRIPGVKSVAFSDRNAIGAGMSITGAEIPGYLENGKHAEIHRHIVGPGYFETLAIPIRVGRPLGAQDTRRAPLAVVVNQKFVDKYMHGDNPVGHEIVMGGKKQPARYQIVGVSSDVKYGRIREESPPTAYFAHAQIFAAVGGQLADVNGFSWPFMTFSVKSPQAGQASLLADIRRELTTLDKNVPMVDVRTETQVISQVLFLDRTFAALSSAFGFLALLLACVGLYGTMAYAVARKTNEIGIRMALGAERGAILSMVLRETAAIVVAGIAVGVPAAWIASSILKTRLFGLTAHDPWSIGLSVVATLLVTMFAGYIPARRASRVDPMVALRYE
ncbi:MAG TPA: ABC transporter permease [Candidatus Binatia bacterium]|nr:ABC transporter permease [Candidatus Binatia bacterium]